jgi:hypothetical protein
MAFGGIIAHSDNHLFVERADHRGAGRLECVTDDFGQVVGMNNGGHRSSPVDYTKPVQISLELAKKGTEADFAQRHPELWQSNPRCRLRSIELAGGAALRSRLLGRGCL